MLNVETKQRDFSVEVFPDFFDYLDFECFVLRGSSILNYFSDCAVLSAYRFIYS